MIIKTLISVLHKAKIRSKTSAFHWKNQRRRQDQSPREQS